MSAARDDYRAAEARLAACELAIEEAQGVENWRTRVELLPPLLLERERLQEESYRAYRRVVAEREG